MRAPYQQHSDTSLAAAEAIQSSAATLRANVLGHIKRMGTMGATDEEIQHALNMQGNTERPRRRELEQAGLISDSGRRRQTLSARYAVVWVLWRPARPANPWSDE